MTCKYMTQTFKLQMTQVAEHTAVEVFVKTDQSLETLMSTSTHTHTHRHTAVIN